MAEYLAIYTKIVLMLLANEFETSVSKMDKNKAIIQAIVVASDYDESFVKIRVQDIFEEKAKRKEQEKNAN